MSVKHTERLTLAEARRRYVDLYVRMKEDRRRLKLADRMHGMPDASVYSYSSGTVTLSDMSDAQMRHAYVLVDLAMRRPSWESFASHRGIDFSNEELEQELERINDAIHDGEGTENYLIVERPDED